MSRDRRARRVAQGTPGAARQRHRLRRRRGGNPLHAGAADQRRRPRGGLASHHGAPEALQRHQSLHNGLQGPTWTSRRSRRRPTKRSPSNADALTGALRLRRHPRPAAARHPRLRSVASRTAAPGGSGAATSTPRRPTRDSTSTCGPTCRYDAAVFTLADYVPEGPTFRAAIPPTIDPLAPKNLPLSPRRTGATSCASSGWTWTARCSSRSRASTRGRTPRRHRRLPCRQDEEPDVQFVLAGSMASDDPEGWDYHERTSTRGRDTDVLVLPNLQRRRRRDQRPPEPADVVVQKSTREGFGLTVTEGLWKGRPVVGGNVGGIPLQIETARRVTW